jgi:hypothetical protein
MCNNQVRPLPHFLLGLPHSRVSVQLHPALFIYYINGQIISFAHKMLLAVATCSWDLTPDFWFQTPGEPSGSPDLMFSRNEKYPRAREKDIVNKQGPHIKLGRLIIIRH